jgi:hemolysin D
MAMLRLLISRMLSLPPQGRRPTRKKAMGDRLPTLQGRRQPQRSTQRTKAIVPVKRNSDEMAFLPAALEIVETPPSPAGRAVGAVIIAIFCLSLIWACLGRIDIVASAVGKIVTNGRAKIIQPFETGVIRAIRVQDGQSVKVGDALIELDPTINEAERDHLLGDLIASQLDIARLRAGLAEGSDPVAEFNPPQDARPELVAMQRRFLVDQAAEHRAKLAAARYQIQQKEAEASTIEATINKLETIIPVLQQRADIRKELFEHQTGSKITYLEDLRVLLDSKQELEVQKSRLVEARAALAAVTESRAQIDAEYRRNLSSDLAEAERKAAGLGKDLDKINKRTRLQVLTSPVDGVVQQLAVHTVGGVVTPAQALLVVVPSDSPLEIEATVSNRDVGFVHQGQQAEIKVDTFNFTRYGLLSGKVLGVSRDSVTRDKPQNKTGQAIQGAEATSSEPPGQELSYVARISLNRAQMQIDNGLVDLLPGMAVTAEIKTGSRRIISYLLSPLLRYGQESLRER